MEITASLLTLHFVRPWMFWGLVALPLIYWLVQRSVKNSHWSRWIKEPLLSLLVNDKSNAIGWYKWTLTLFFLCGIIVVAGPALEKQPTPLQKSPASIYFVLDLSLSMLASDVTPNRLGLARFKISDILKQHPDATAALIVYAGSAHRVIPLTEDHATIINQLPALNPEIMPSFGSNAQAAMQIVVDSFTALKLPQATVIWFTDESSNQQIGAVAQQLSQQNINLKLIAIGTAQGGEVPLQNGRKLLNNAGNKVIASVPLQLMQASAKKHGIDYYQAQQLMPRLITQMSSQRQPTEQSKKRLSTTTQWQELGYWLLPLMLLLLAPLLRRQVSLLLTGLTLLVLWASPQTALATWQNWWLTPNQQGQQLFDEGNYAQAMETFLNPQWRVASQYRAKQFAQAAKNYQTLGEYYNAGNAYAMAGDLPQAIAAYNEALARNPEHTDAKYNKDLIEQLLQQQQQQNQQSQDSQTQQQDGNANQSAEDAKQQSSNDKQQADEQSAHNEQSQSNATNKQELSDDKSHLQQPSTHSQALSTQTTEFSNEPQVSTQTSHTSSDTRQTQLSREEIATQEAQMQYQQWLRTIPDNPSLLLQRKFDYQYRNSQQQPQSSKNW